MRAPFVPALRPDPGTAREWVRAELAERPYQPTPLERISDWFWGLLDRVGDAASNVGRLSPAVALALLVILLGLLAVFLSRIRRSPSGLSASRVVIGDSAATARDHRDRMARAHAEERWDDVVVDGVRALALGLSERALVDDLPGLTAHEIGIAAIRSFPAYQAQVTRAARLFDDVRYGDRHATRQQAEDVMTVEAALRDARPTAGEVGNLAMTVPR